MQLAAFAKNARDVIKAGNLRWDLSLIRSEMTTDHRISDRRFLADMLPEGGIGAEIGVFTGLFSTVLLEVARPKKIYFVDPWWKAYGRNYPDWGRYTDYGRLSTKAAYETALRRTASHSRGAVVDIQVDRSQAFLPLMPDRYFDWTYLDSTHSYEDTKTELGLLRSKMKQGSIIAGDDWRDDPTHPHFGAARAVREAVTRGEYQLLSVMPAWQWAVRAP